MRDAELLENALHGSVRALDQAQEHMLHGYVFILHVVGLRLRRVERSVHILRDVYFALLATRAGHARDAANGLFARLDETAGLCIQLLQKLGGSARPPGLPGHKPNALAQSVDFDIVWR